ncbi:hypothetical protein ACP275_09G090900 [Erythranthe tilingii]
MNPNMQMMLIVLTVLVVSAAGIHARILPDYAPTMDSSSSTNLVYSVKEVVCKWLTRVTNNSADNIINLCDKGIIVISSPDLGKTKAPAPPPPKPSPGSRPLVAYS